MAADSPPGHVFALDLSGLRAPGVTVWTARAAGRVAAPGARLAAVTTLSFDIAVLELLLPLAVGAQAVIASREEVQDPRQLALLILRHEITAMQATPSAWRLCDGDDCRDLGAEPGEAITIKPCP